MNKTKIFISLLVNIVFLPIIFAQPSITKVIYNQNTLVIDGSGFGIKQIAPPIKFTNFDSDITGQVPSGWDAPLRTDSIISDTISHSGSKSLDSSAINKTSDYFSRISWDMGKTIPLNGLLYLSAWLYLDKTETTATSWNWKGPIATSSKTPYYWSSGTTTNTAIGFGGFYFESEKRWGNTAGVIQYSSNNNALYNYGTSGNNWAADSFTFNNWQRIEWIFKASSSLDVSDGAITVNRIGRASPILATKECLTHGNTSSLWRYVSLPQGITNIMGGTLNLKMYFDDVYIDDSIARVEICDSPNWVDRTHCEIQIPSHWSDRQITVTFNLGNFIIGQNIYAYVVNVNGVSNSTGVKIIPQLAAPRNFNQGNNNQ